MGFSDTAGETLKIAAVLEAVAAALGVGDLSACLGAGRVPSVDGGPWGHSIPSHGRRAAGMAESCHARQRVILPWYQGSAGHIAKLLSRFVGFAPYPVLVALGNATVPRLKA